MRTLEGGNLRLIFQFSSGGGPWQMTSFSYLRREEGFLTVRSVEHKLHNVFPKRLCTQMDATSRVSLTIFSSWKCPMSVTILKTRRSLVAKELCFTQYFLTILEHGQHFGEPFIIKVCSKEHTAKPEQLHTSPVRSRPCPCAHTVPGTE